MGNRTLVVGPMGERPWMPMHEFADVLRAEGHDVVVNGSPDDVLLYPTYGSTRALALLAALVRWRHKARARLNDAGITRIIVWDEVVAALCCLAAPRGVEVAWIAGTPEGMRLHQRAARALVMRRATRTASFWGPAPRVVSAHVPGWVVFGSEREPKHHALTRLRARAANEPALALVFDARRHDAVTPATMAALVEACDPRAVWWVGDDEWITRLGGVPQEAVDPAFGGTPDHRHERMGDRWSAL